MVKTMFAEKKNVYKKGNQIPLEYWETLEDRSYIHLEHVWRCVKCLGILM